MFFVIISAWNDMYREVLEKNGFELVKKFEQNYFYYYPNEDGNIMLKVQGLIYRNFGVIALFQVYPLYNGRIDLFEYRSLEVKDSDPYYNGKYKDLSIEEQEEYLAKRKHK